MQNVTSCDILPFCLSDHDCVVLHAHFPSSFPQGPGLWKFNASLLNDSNFCDMISEVIADLALSVKFFSNVKDWWEFFKRSLRTEIIAFSKAKHRETSCTRAVLTEQIISLKQRIVCGEDLTAEIARLESDLQSLIQRDLEGSKIRCRVQWLNEGEKPTRFFFQARALPC